MSKARSPYQRHNKAPYVYSEQLRGWEHAVRNRGDVDRADAAWFRMMRLQKGAKPAGSSLTAQPPADLALHTRRCHVFPLGIRPFTVLKPTRIAAE